MKLLIQKVNYGSVEIQNTIYSSINKGLVVFVGFSKHHTKEKTHSLIKKLLSFRIFPSNEKGFDLSIEDTKGELLVISQFTLFAQTHKGLKPKFNDSLEYEKAKEEYDYFISELKKATFCTVKTGIFGEYMKVKLENDGPVTLLLEK
jgi:D-tyrosyl-tRNA(Tyr) deacylase